MSKLGLVALTILLLSQALPSMLSEAEQAIDLTGKWTGYFTLEFQLVAEKLVGNGKGTVELLIYKQGDDRIEGLISLQVDVLEPESPEVLSWLSGLSGPVSGRVSEKLVPGGTITQVDMVIGFGALPVSGSYDNHSMELSYQEDNPYLKLKIILTREETVLPQPGIGAIFEVSHLTINPTEVSAGEAVEVSVTVTNVGKQSGEYSVTLTINGVVEDAKTVSLAAGESRVVTFIIRKDVAGTYEVVVNGLTGSFRVESYFDFSISVSPTSNSVVRGESAIYTITVSLVSGKGVPVTLHAPKGIGLTFALNPDKGIPPFTSTLTVYTSEVTQLGKWSFTILGEGGGKSRVTGKIYLLVISPEIVEEIKEGIKEATSHRDFRTLYYCWLYATEYGLWDLEKEISKAWSMIDNTGASKRFSFEEFVRYYVLLDDVPSDNGRVSIKLPEPIAEKWEEYYEKWAEAEGPYIAVKRISEEVNALLTYTDKKGETDWGSAEEILDKRKGDCSDHANLLVAILRAIGVPARTVHIEVRVIKTGETGGHRMVEAYINGEWVLFDPTNTYVNDPHIYENWGKRFYERWWGPVFKAITINGEEEDLIKDYRGWRKI